jgi:hypothetical protein
VIEVSCATVASALVDFAKCEETPNGARIITHCLYPSFNPVAVYVVRFGEGFIVHDDGEAKAMAWEHGRDDRVTSRYLNEQAQRYALAYERGRLSVTVQNGDWLAPAILAVANAACAAVNQAVAHIARSSMIVLQDAIYEALLAKYDKERVIKEPSRVGASGRTYEFDFGVQEAGRLVLIDAVTPHAISINTKYTAFADVGRLIGNRGLAVFDRPLASEDKTLLSDVADVVPFKSMTAEVQRALTHP